MQPVSNSGQAEDKGCCKKAQPTQRIWRGEEKGDRMRKAAGILMVAFALLLIITVISDLNRFGFGGYELVFSLLPIIPAGFIFTGGVFCLMRRHWKVCYPSAVVALLIMIVWLIGHAADSIWLAWVVSMVGTLPIIFVYLTKKEWEETQV